MPFEFNPTPTSVLFSLSVLSAIYVMGGCLCRIRHRSSQIKHAWKVIYIVILGLAGWALCDLLLGDSTLFQQAVCVTNACYMHLTKDAWLRGPPAIAKTSTEPAALTYAHVRSQIKTGDMIGIQTGTLGGHIVQAGQVVAGLEWSHITHCAVAVWEGSRLMVLEMGPSGNILKPLSQYAGKRMVVCAPSAGTDMRRFDVAFDQVTAHHVPYSGGDLVRIGLRLLPMRLIDTRGWGGDGDADKVCSLLPAMLYARMGGDVREIPALAAPAEVAAALPVLFEVFGK